MSKTQEFDTTELDHGSVVAESSSHKVGWITALALLTIVGIVVWLLMNGDDQTA